MNFDDILLVVLAPISAVIMSLYAYRVYSFKLPSGNDLKRARFGAFGGWILKKINLFKFIGPSVFAIGMTFSAIYGISNAVIFFNASVVLCIFGLLLVWLCVSWDIFIK